MRSAEFVDGTKEVNLRLTHIRRRVKLTGMKPPFDAIGFRKVVEEDFSRAYKLVSELVKYETGDDFDENGELIELDIHAESDFRDVLTRIHERLAIALEFAALPNALNRMMKRFDTHAENLIKLEYLPLFGIYLSPVLNDLSMAYESFAACLDGSLGLALEAERERHLLRQILHGSPKLMVDRRVLPKNEADVRREIYGMLLHVFPDTVRELPIPQISKTYKPDIGIPHLQVAIEYKFCDSETELKRCLEGIYADTRGYAGSKDWTSFIGVLYCTGSFMTDAQLREELRRIGMPSSWELFIVTGQGNRMNKNKGLKSNRGKSSR